MKEEEQRKQNKTEAELDYERLLREQRDQEILNRCLTLADKGKQFEEQRKQKIQDIKDNKERQESKDANQLKLMLKKSKESYKIIEKQHVNPKPIHTQIPI